MQYVNDWESDKPHYMAVYPWGKDIPQSLAQARIDICKAFSKEKQGDEPANNKKSSRPRLDYIFEYNNSFYPTPSSLCGKMLAEVLRMKKLHHLRLMYILEPSAGKGDIIDALFNVKLHFRKAGDSYSVFDKKTQDIDCIEIDPNLRAILKDKEYRVVHDDYLTFSTLKQYDLIIMNPCFEDGDKHLLKAIQMQARCGGMIVCLLNAETIRNACTNSRKLLNARLRQFNARIQYISHAFRKAERRTDVEVALISIDIPVPEVNSEIWERLSKSNNPYFDATVKENGLIAADTKIDLLIHQYQVETRAALEFFREFNAITAHVAGLALSTYRSQAHDKLTNSEVVEYLNKTKLNYWERLFDLPELVNRFTSEIREQYKKTIQKGDYEFSLFNIMELLKDLNGQLKQSVRKAIFDVFDKLSAEFTYHPEAFESSEYRQNIHYFNGWRTNKAHKINKKVIIPCNDAFAYSWSGDKEKLDYRRLCELLGDIEKTLDYIDGETSTMGSKHSYTINNAIEMGVTTFMTKYARIVIYKKGTMHILFRDQLIVDKLNIYVGMERGWLPPQYGKTRYSDLSKEEQAVVKDFHEGDTRYYDMVCGHSKNYLADVNCSDALLLLSEGAGQIAG